MVSTTSEKALYLYGIVRERDAAAMGAIGLEVAGRPGDVFPIAEGGVSAVVSRFPSRGKVLPIRRNLDAQNRVLRELGKSRGGVLPLRFGHLVPGERAVRRMLSTRREEILRELAALEGKVEMALTMAWEVDNIFAYFATQHAELRAMRDELFGEGREPPRDALVELGHVFSDLLAEDRRKLTEQITLSLGDLVAGVKEDPPRTEKVVMSLALLVERERLPELEARVEAIASEMPEVLMFKYTGPFAPFHFVGLDLADDDEDEEVPS